MHTHIYVLFSVIIILITIWSRESKRDKYIGIGITLLSTIRRSTDNFLSKKVVKMLTLTLEFMLASFAAFFIFALFFRKKNTNFPPGPKGLPILGSILQLRRDSPRTFMKWRKIYGDIIGVQLGATSVVVLNNYHHIKEAFNDLRFSGRPQIPLITTFRNGGPQRGIVFNEGQKWQEQRRFSLKHLRDFGFGKKGMEGFVMTEVEEMTENFRRQIKNGGGGQVEISTEGHFNVAVLNALWSIVCGKRYSHDDPTLKKIHDGFTQVTSEPSLMLILSQFFKFAEIAFTIAPNYVAKQGVSFVTTARGLLREIIVEEKKSFEPGSNNPRHFIDVYLEEMRLRKEGSSFWKQNGEDQLLVVLFDFITAGSETTSNTLVWACLLLAVYPKIQDRLHAQIDKVVGTSRHVSLDDRSDLPLLEAVILETLRFSSLTPLGVQHRTLEDVEFHGHKIPRDTIIVSNLFAVSRDPDLWTDPETFNPDRFLSKDGLSIVRNEALIPFSTGKRICIGESLAKDELYLFLGNLVHQFKWTTVKGQSVPTLESELNQPILGFRHPKPHTLLFSDRQDGV